MNGIYSQNIATVGYYVTSDCNSGNVNNTALGKYSKEIRPRNVGRFCVPRCSISPS